MKLGFRILLTATIVFSAVGYVRSGAASEVTTLEPQGGVGAERGVVLVRCRTDRPNVWSLSRGALLDLDLGGADRDLVLTTAHGLLTGLESTQRDCRVLGTHGRTYGIEGVWRATNDETGRSRDWAVLLIERRLAGDVGRLHLGQFTAEGMLRFTAEKAPVRLLSLNARSQQRDCSLYPVGSEAVEPRLTGLMFYSCHGSPGLSGSPILAGIDGRPLLIGIHVGWGLVRVGGGGMRSVSVGHAIDTEIAAAIVAAVAHARN